MDFRPHSPKQDAALFFSTPIGVAATGIQWGKTRVGAAWMKLQNHSFTEPDDNFLIVSPTYKIMQQSTLPPYLDMMRGVGDFSKADMTLKIHGGGTVYCRTGTDADSIVGITNVRAVWGDEAGLFSLYFWENIQARAAFKSAQIMLTTSPYALNWLYKEIIRPKMKDASARPDATLIQARSDENPFFPKETYQRNQLTMDPRRFNAMFGGRWERMAGLVYDCFDEVENQCEPCALPTGTRYVGGIDWGYTEPFCFKIRAITPTGHHFGVHELYRSGMTSSDVVVAIKRLVTTYNVRPVYCDPSQPGMIEELCRGGVAAVPADNDVRVGIDRHYELLKTRKLKYFKGANPYTLDEIDSYHYPEPEDLGPDKAIKESKPVQQNDHAMDCDRYITMMTYLSAGKRQPTVPEERPKEDQYARIERLKRRARVEAQTERWS